MSETHRNYLRDLGYLVRAAALEARASAKSSTSEFDKGRSLAYYEVASLMQQQAEAFDLAPHDLAFEGFEPDRDLL